MKCVGIIWNCELPCKKEIFKFLDSNTLVCSTFDLHLGTSFDAFVRDLYPLSSIAAWKVDQKIIHMRKSSQSTDVCVVIFEINGTDTFFNPYKHCMVNAKLELLKLWIRQVSQSHISNYFYDIAFHCSDSEAEYDFDMNIIKKYKGIK